MSDERDRMYEQERLILYVQERLAEAVELAGIKRAEVARRLGTSPAYVTMVLNQGQNLSLETVANFAHACGYRIVPTLEPLIKRKRGGG